MSSALADILAFFFFFFNNKRFDCVQTYLALDQNGTN